MKIRSSRVPELLKSLGLQDVQVVGEEDEETYDESGFFETVDANRSVVLEPKITEKLIGELKGKTGGILRGQLVRLTGISRKVLDEFSTDEEAIKAALAFREEKYSADSKTMREQLDSIASGHQTELEKLKAEYEGKVNEANQKYISRDIDDFLLTKLDKKALPEGADKKRIAAVLKDQLSKRIDLGFDETERKVLTFQKGTKNPALNGVGNNAFDWDEAIEAELAPMGLLRKDMRDVNPADVLGKGGSYSNGTPAPGQLPAGPVTDYNTQRAAAMEKIAG